MELIQMFDSNSHPEVEVRSIGTVIAKPTRACNADCSYCCAPAYDNNNWSIDTFKRYFDSVSPHMFDGGLWLWHGGEPMLQSPSFYREAREYVDKTRPDIQFAMQSNILKYSTKKWKDTLNNVFKGQISTSFEPDAQHRTVNGDPKKYAEQFLKAMRNMLDDGFDMFVIGVFDDQNIDYADSLYDLAMEYEGRVNIRINYKLPIGRIKSESPKLLLDPVVYGNKLIELERKRKKDNSKVGIVPNDIMKDRLMGRFFPICPWISTCGGGLLGIEPNGDVFNCDNYAELNDSQFKFGNLDNDSMPQILNSVALNKMKQRPYSLDPTCYECEYQHACQGGCSRDSYIFTGDTNGKFPYCKSWKMIFGEMDS